MTKETCLKLLKHFEDKGMNKEYEDMKQHILNSAKFSLEEKEDLFKLKKEAVKSGKKSKG